MDFYRVVAEVPDHWQKKLGRLYTLRSTDRRVVLEYHLRFGDNATEARHGRENYWPSDQHVGLPLEQSLSLAKELELSKAGVTVRTSIRRKEL